MTDTDISTLLTAPENEHCEFKSAQQGFGEEKLREYVCALANEGGGILVLGITDKIPRKVVGTNAFRNIPEIKQKLFERFRFRIEIEEKSAEGQKRVLIFHVPSLTLDMPVSVDGRFLMRVGESLQPMSADQMRRFFDKRVSDFSALICPEATLEDLEERAVAFFRDACIRKSGNERYRALTVEQFLADTELLVDGGVTYAALILFGTHSALGKFLSCSEVCYEFRSDNQTGAAQKRQDFRKGFFGYFEELQQLIDQRNANQHYREGLFIFNFKTFNELSIREALLNAVCHRDYRSCGSIFIRHYNDRIVFSNPGGLLSGITLENILWNHAPRNRRLAESFGRCGLVERSGQGMNAIFENCIKECKELPDFTNTDESQFWITLHGTIKNPEFLPIIEKISNEKRYSFSTEDFLTIQQVFDHSPVPDRLLSYANRLKDVGILETTPRKGKDHWVLSRKMYSAVGKSGQYTRRKGLDASYNKELLYKHIQESGTEGAALRELQEVLGFLARGTVQSLLRQLRNDGRIEMRGKTSNARWFVCRQKPEE